MRGADRDAKGASAPSALGKFCALVALAAAGRPLNLVVRRMRHVLVLLTTAVAAASGGVAAWRIHPDHAGPASIGISAQELGRLVGTSITIPSDPEEAACFYVTHPEMKGLSFMLSRQHLARVDVDDPSIQTAEGAKVGDSIAKVVALYGESLEKLPHKYLGLPDLYLTHRSKD